MAESTSPLLRTPLNAEHRAAGGRMVPFGGWEMPLQYTSILAEARAVRSGVGVFDVSHMARLHVRGEDATAFLDRVLTARVAALRPGRARYTFLLNEDGGIIDDGVVARLDDSRGAEDHLLLVVQRCHALDGAGLAGAMVGGVPPPAGPRRHDGNGDGGRSGPAGGCAVGRAWPRGRHRRCVRSPASR